MYYCSDKLKNIKLPMQINDKNLMLWQLQSKNNTFLKNWEDIALALTCLIAYVKYCVNNNDFKGSRQLKFWDMWIVIHQWQPNPIQLCFQTCK